VCAIRSRLRHHIKKRVRRVYPGVKVPNFDWQFPHANAGSMVDRRCDLGRDTGQADLADSARTKFVDLFVWIIEEMHFNRRSVSIHRHDVVGQITVDSARRSADRRTCALTAPYRFP